MIAFNILFVIASVVISTTHAQQCSNCDVILDRDIRIPPAMSLKDFKNHYATNGVQMSELYYVLRNPKPWEPYYNFRINYTATPNNKFQEDIEADELGLVGDIEPACIRVDKELVPVEVDESKGKEDETANFMRGTSTVMQTFWSSCPSKYVWAMKCKDWVYSNRNCPLEKVTLELLVPKVGQYALDSLPLSAILNDLRETNLIFGADNLYWAYTFGKSELCT